MNLATYAYGRDNNFNVIRLIAAFSVLVSHSFALALGSPLAEPLRDRLGMSLGSIAVDIFFVTSGFLVGGSIFTRNNICDFFVGRILRIYPALVIVILITVFVIAPVVSGKSPDEYFLSRDTWVYLVKGVTVIFGIDTSIPGVFENNPFRNAVNGSLWTLPYELWMYCSLAVFWLFLNRFGCKRKQVEIFIFALVLLGFVLIFLIKFSGCVIPKFLHLFVVFFYGTFFWIFKEKISLSVRLLVLALAVLFVTYIVWWQYFYFVYLLVLPYFVFCLAFLPGGWIRKYNELGDYSYGMYIFAFPVQQIIAMKLPGISPFGITVFSGLITLLISICSWYFIERKFMEKRSLLNSILCGAFSRTHRG